MDIVINRLSKKFGNKEVLRDFPCELRKEPPFPSWLHQGKERPHY